MSTALRCACGQVEGVVRGSGNRVRCYCDDCQAFAVWLGREDTLDEAGGSDILGVAPGQLTFTRGAHLLRAVRLSDRGMVRWYADCCRAPIGNVLAWARPPFIGLAAGRLDPAALPPNVTASQTKFARRPVPEPIGPLLRVIAASVAVLARGWWSGAASPFPPGAPVTTLTPDQRRALG